MALLLGSNSTKKLENDLYAEGDVSSLDLMQRAGERAFRYLQYHWPEVRSLLVVCGQGHNSGDGVVLARLALEAGFSVRLLRISSRFISSPVVQAVMREFREAGGKEVYFDGGELPEGELIVDALLGMGNQRELTGRWLDLIELINHDSRPVFALDVPSGLCSDTGALNGIAIQANRTLSFITPKPGLVTGKALDYTGTYDYDDLGISSARIQTYHSGFFTLGYAGLSQFLKPREKSAHKNRFGHVLVIGGDYGMAGAARLAAEACFRVGAGLVSVATRAAHIPVIMAGRPELMVHGVESVADLTPLLTKADVLVIGPGLGQADWGKALFKKAIAANLPMIIDADALNILSTMRKRAGFKNAIFTPHPGEAARLLKKTPVDIEADRYQASIDLYDRYQAVTIIKGAGTVIHSEGVTAVCTEGNPGMAVAGMGDVLSGVLAGLVAQSYPLPQAARMGVCLHAHAGDACAKADGERGLLASDLLPYLRKFINPTASR